MKVSEIKQSDIHIGLRVKDNTTGKYGKVVFIDINDDYFSYVKWDDKPYATSGFYGTDSNYEIEERVWPEWCCVQSAELFRRLAAFVQSAALKFQHRKK